MREMLARRMDMKEVFVDASPLDDLIAASGGYPRDFLRMMRELFLSAIMEEIPAPIPRNKLKALVTKVINDQVAVYERAVYDEDVPLLVTVAQTHNVPRVQRDETFRIAELFDSHSVLGYRNGEEWYDLHPLVRESAKIKEALKKANGHKKQPSS